MESTVGPCPLGNECEKVVNNKLQICPWYVKVRGKDPQSNEELDEWRCAMAWMPLLMVEHSLFERQTGAAVESFRNEMVKQNNTLAATLSLVVHEQDTLLEHTES